ncbi:LOW QUALITY PROTEIN: dehydrogenase/reductase SDR family protein 7-like [Pararge aegeria]|uniref:LOW QUALITY PROTEIN: dehydrogenase/reductase SDR family protein 7-like n=1 Tax=Pararge aegeria TaxID=116150 RepID=UPI0019D20B98|nr:LOW QUALITY PROTEIN: dehydrogenase/reductase SDR family protein 7-like [Pararge aegeria]
MSYMDKVIVVTGASLGIGAAVALKFAKEGAKVAIVGRNYRKLDYVENINYNLKYTVLHLASDKAKSITGTYFVIDNGFLLTMQ